MQFLKLAGLVGLSLCAAEDVEVQEEQHEVPSFKATSIKAPFLDQFLSDSKWVHSTSKKIVDGVEDEDLLAYRGEFKVEALAKELISNDLALVLKTEAAHAAITALFEKPLDCTGKALVVQYEVGFQNGLECGGAYMKLFTYDPAFKAEDMSDKTPYTVMFGPDKCGGSNKVHFIFRHENTKTHEITEKHVMSPPVSSAEKGKTVLYTLIVRPDNTFEIKVDNESVKSGSLLEDFEPAVNPEKEIDDKEDSKPVDWVNDAKMDDPEAVKPDDWDEEAPMQIVDENASQPEDWLENEPETIPDPEVTKPEDWDDEEDGTWTAPSISNPLCAAGCGKWTAPMIRNPAYKGKFVAPKIDNPAYKGVWAPRKIANPDYVEDLHPSNFKKIGAIGFELWSMQSGFAFDNIYIGHSEKDASALAEETWVVKNKMETVKEKEAAKEQEAAKESTGGVIEEIKARATEFLEQLYAFIEFAQSDFVGAVKEMPQVAGFLILAVLIPLVCLSLLFGGSSEAPKKTKKAEEKKDVIEPESSASGVEKSVDVKKRTATKKD